MTVPTQVTEGLREAVAHHLGKRDGGTAFSVDPIDGKFVRALRKRLGLTQREFAIKFGFSLKTLQKWEADYRTPEGPARAYLMVISEIPDEVISAFKNAAERRVTHTS